MNLPTIFVVSFFGAFLVLDFVRWLALGTLFIQQVRKKIHDEDVLHSVRHWGKISNEGYSRGCYYYGGTLPIYLQPISLAVAFILTARRGDS